VERAQGWTGTRRRLAVKRLARREAVALSLAGLVLLLVTTGALAVTGDLSQPPGPAGCISETGAGPCIDGHALDGANSVAVSPNGKSVYVAASASNAVVRLNRNTVAGAIGQPAGTAGCVSITSEPCASAHALLAPTSVAVSPDGKSVYVASRDAHAVVRLNRNTTTGAISQPVGTSGCISQNGAGSCADGHGLGDPFAVAVSPDGKSVYVASSNGNAVVRLNRNTTTGAITQPVGTAGCVSETGSGGGLGEGPCADGHGLLAPTSVAVSPDGKSVYVASLGSDAVARLDRNTTTGAITQPAGTAGCVSETGSGPCADGHALDDPLGVASSADGKSVYVASVSSDAVARLDRDTTTGAISQPADTAGCVSETGSGPCADGHGLGGPASVAVSADGLSVYAASNEANAVARLARDATTGAISQPAGTAGCISETGAGPCANGHALLAPRSVGVSPDGKSVYVASVSSDAVARFNRAP
jgi:DNA-binding beta-propeller fold protein YncE